MTNTASQLHPVKYTYKLEEVTNGIRREYR